MKLYFYCLITAFFALGCCACGKQEQPSSISKVQNSSKVSGTTQNKSVEENASEKEEMTEKEKQFAQDVEFIHGFTLQHGFNPNAKKPGNKTEEPVIEKPVQKQK